MFPHWHIIGLILSVTEYSKTVRNIDLCKCSCWINKVISQHSSSWLIQATKEITLMRIGRCDKTAVALYTNYITLFAHMIGMIHQHILQRLVFQSVRTSEHWSPVGHSGIVVSISASWYIRIICMIVSTIEWLNLTSTLGYTSWTWILNITWWLRQ